MKTKKSITLFSLLLWGKGGVRVIVLPGFLRGKDSLNGVQSGGRVMLFPSFVAKSDGEVYEG